MTTTQNNRRRYSTSRRQLPGGFKVAASLGAFDRPGINFDVGGGAFDEGSRWLAERGVENVIYDPFSRSRDQNQSALARLFVKPADSATLFNVLNVITNDKERRVALSIAALHMSVGALAWIDVYEGDRSGVGKPTSCGWQENRRLETYVDEVATAFDEVEILAGRIIRARRKP